MRTGSRKIVAIVANPADRILHKPNPAEAQALFDTVLFQNPGPRKKPFGGWHPTLPVLRGVISDKGHTWGSAWTKLHDDLEESGGHPPEPESQRVNVQANGKVVPAENRPKGFKVESPIHFVSK